MPAAWGRTAISWLVPAARCERQATRTDRRRRRLLDRWLSAFDEIAAGWWRPSMTGGRISSGDESGHLPGRREHVIVCADGPPERRANASIVLSREGQQHGAHRPCPLRFASR